jgi:glyoxylase-like metal-dependent hydrolase (beta-lactamase superfamily II)
MQLIRLGERFAEVLIDKLSVIVLSDGETEASLQNILAPDGEPLLTEDVDPSLKGVKLKVPVNAFVVRGRSGMLLIDTGAGKAGPKTLGRLQRAMMEAGIEPRAMRQIALTHSHPETVGGLMGPDAQIHYWKTGRIHVPVGDLDSYKLTKGLGPMAHRGSPLKPGGILMYGVEPMAAPGHTPGHMAYLVERSFLIWGAAVHAPSLQFSKPQLGWVEDEDHLQAYETRLRLMHLAARERWLIAGAHLPFPGVGRVYAEGEGFRFRSIREMLF